MSRTVEQHDHVLRFRLHSAWQNYVFHKGFIALDGASLTVTEKDADHFSVSLVLYTQEHTNLTDREPGDSINLETDLLARYVEQLLQERSAAEA